MKRILLQAGHVAPREPGFEGGTGTVREQEFAGKMQAALATMFRADGRFNVDTCPGDIPDGWRGDVFLALHGDGASPLSHGYSFGWPANGRDPGQGPALATRIGRRWATIGHPGGHHADNYTDGMRGYYGWSRTVAPAKVLIEHGFLTNPGEQAWMFSHIPDMARATYQGVLDHLGMSAAPNVNPAKFAPPWPIFTRTRQIANARLTNPVAIYRIRKSLREAGKTAPYTARLVDGSFLASGDFGVPWSFTKAVSRQLRAGRDVVIDGVVTIHTRRA